MAISKRKEISKEEAIVIGEKAAEITNSDAWRRAVDGLHEKYFEAWRKASDSAAREVVHAKLSVLDDVTAEFRVMENASVLLKHERA